MADVDILQDILKDSNYHLSLFSTEEIEALRTKSKDLLESAKRAVEMAIEEGEEKALGWLKENTTE